MKREKGKKYDGRTRPTNEAYKNGWNEIFLNKVMKEEVEIGATVHKNIESNTDPIKERCFNLLYWFCYLVVGLWILGQTDLTLKNW